MPARNVIKPYVENGYYHIYNRGVEKRNIFLDNQDYAVFLNYLKEYLLPKDVNVLQNIISSPAIPWSEKGKSLKLLRLNNFSDEIKLICHTLMPNHFHFLIKQKNANSIDKFIQSLCTRYTGYFNKKYKRVGSLYQDTYKGVLVETEEQLLHLTRYIHKQAMCLQGDTLQTQTQPSSYLEYIGKRKTEWINTQEVLAYFSKVNPRQDYVKFVFETDDFETIAPLLLDSDN